MKETNTKLNTILVKLTDITGFDHTPLALEAFAVAETDIKLLIQEAVAEDRERMMRGILELPRFTEEDDRGVKFPMVEIESIKNYAEQKGINLSQDINKEIDGIKITDARIGVQETLQTNEVY